MKLRPLTPSDRPRIDALLSKVEAFTDDVAPTPDGAEIIALRWFERGEIAALAASGEIRLPGGASIARAIIELSLIHISEPTRPY